KRERATLASAQPPHRARQCFVLIRAVLLLGQHRSALLAFLLGSNKAHDAIDSDGVAPLVEPFDYDCSLAGFHGGTLPFHPLICLYVDVAKPPDDTEPAKRPKLPPRRRPRKSRPPPPRFKPAPRPLPHPPHSVRTRSSQVTAHNAIAMRSRNTQDIAESPRMA